MKIKLYHYIHCPYCIRVRMALGLLNLSYESIPLQYDDEVTPVKLTGVKMLPIIEIDSENSNESLDIIKKIDLNKTINFSNADEVENLVNSLSPELFNLCMPIWVISSEFTESSRKYFIDKKSKKRGPFNLLYQNRFEFIKSLNSKLNILEDKIDEFYLDNHFGIKDIMIASHLWGLYQVNDFQFSPKLHHYLQNIRRITNFNYLQDFWN